MVDLVNAEIMLDQRVNKRDFRLKLNGVEFEAVKSIALDVDVDTIPVLKVEFYLESLNISD